MGVWVISRMSAHGVPSIPSEPEPDFSSREAFGHWGSGGILQGRFFTLIAASNVGAFLKPTAERDQPLAVLVAQHALLGDADILANGSPSSAVGKRSRNRTPSSSPSLVKAANTLSAFLAYDHSRADMRG